MGDLLKGKNAVITGAGQGIGEAIARKFAENGANVVITDIAVDRAEEVAKSLREMGVKSIAVKMDVSNLAEVNRKIDEIRKEFGRIDIWVNNAGIAQEVNIEELTEKDWDRVMNINLKSVFFCTQAIFKVMKEQKYGKIVNMSSLAGERGGRSAGAHYSASKAGVIVLSKCFALSGGEYNITANSICPGLIDTAMGAGLSWYHQDNKIPLVRFGTTEEVANAALFYASDLSSYVTGDTIDVNGGLHMR